MASAQHSYALFETAIGWCGIAWRDDGAGGSLVSAVQLPDVHEAATRTRLSRRHPGAVEATPPPVIARAIDGIIALLSGEPCDLTAIPLDMDDVPAFDRSVYELARAIPPGATRAYGDLAAQLGGPGASRAVAQALGRNPFAIVVPCHRVIAAGGQPGGFSATGGVSAKLRILEIERASGVRRRLPGM